MAAKPDKRKTAWKAVMAAKAQVVAAEPLKGRAVRGYVVDQLKKRKLALADDAVEEVVERVGQDLRRLMGELDKLEAYAQGKPGRLSGDDVAAVLGRGLAPPLYKLADAVTARRAGTVLGLLETVLGEGEPPLKVLATLHRAIRQVRGAKALQEARAPRDMVASRLGVMPFKVGDLLQAARAWSEDDLRRATAALDLADRRVKTGSDPGMALTAAVVEATRSPRPSPRTAR
jgi:DNA polymerase-3 subunit delta